MLVIHKVMLSTEHCHQEYMQSKLCSTKLMLCFDGPFPTIHAHPFKSHYTLDLPNEPNHFLTFHTSQLRPFMKNNDTLFPSHTMLNLDQW